MITKIIQIQSVSRFKHFSSSDTKLTLSSSNMIFAPNGRGKSTISSIIQSFIANDPELLVPRISKVYPGTPQIRITHSNPMVTSMFGSGQVWSNPLSGYNCLVFDKQFIQDNIHTVTVEHDHKKKLHELIVGEGAIGARKLVTEKRAILTELQKVKVQLSREFSLLGTVGINIDEFSKIVPQDVITLNSEKQLLEKQLEAIGNPGIIKAKATLNKVANPYTVATTVKNSCIETISGGSREALELINAHSESHIQGTELERKQFIASSVRALGSKSATNCPTCGQIIGEEAKSLVDSMFTIFSAKYTELRKMISTAIGHLESLDDSSKAEFVLQSIEINSTRYGEWSKYVDNLPALHQIPELEKLISEVVRENKEVIKKLTTKLDNLTDVIGKEFESYEKSVNALSAHLTKYNTAIDMINVQIETYKSTLSTSQKQGIEEKLINVKNRIIRSTKNGMTIVKAYKVNEPAVANADRGLRQALKDFEIAQKAVINDHGVMINDILKKTGAKFRICDIAQGTRPGSTDPYIEYSINLIGGTTDAQTSAGDAIGYVLSDGERNLLAYAFFWSLLNHVDLQKTIAIFDDPLSSVDSNWRMHLIDSLIDITNKGLLQLFVLTHYEYFGRNLANQLPSIKQLTISHKGASKGNILEPYDIESESRELQYARIIKLRDYLANPSTSSPEEIQGAIRNCLECALKNKYYLKLESKIEGKAWLRDFIEEPSVKSILVTNGTYSQLTSLCTISGYAHHDNPPAMALDEDQAMSYAQQTLDVLETL